MRHFTTMEQLEKQDIYELLEEAKRCKKQNGFKESSEAFIANVFYEPSTRTKLSFEAAEKRLGYTPLNVDCDHSSIQKGESLYDTVRTLQALGAAAVVIRHPENNYYNQLQDISIPIINGGDGSGQHPSQSLLDMFTIYEEFGTFQGVRVAIIGDVLHSRVAGSNISALQKLGAEVIVAGPSEWTKRVDQSLNVMTVDEAVANADVVMMLRVQHERHVETLDMRNYHEAYGLTVERAETMKETSIIMHPGPFNRDVEIASELVECHKSRIFTQVENGVFCRMAIINAMVRANLVQELKGVM
ncbi:aspartate carbamoyltransferase catalytic subunit [Geomicrobium sediminis]|uniref:Aspartate carbamoyltransferase n=1 Tax=Geomicrobium sediminis TaxID=1347788 RepID=A0ABS2PCH3_9BACL|nr:aspartate carbamoyltransferase catalytic subunit [Geomicrobium sediminis]MBM7632518.1 aspartate carbamoyltransferase catalytic subunit [Geomicrobium sediminis]